jgi:metacaspase-1
MCKNWFHKPDPVVPIPDPIPGDHQPTKKGLLFGDNYPDTSYALHGCIHDIDDVELKNTKDAMGYIISKFKNAEVTCNRFYTEIKNALLASQSGDSILIWYSGHGTQIPNSYEPDGYDEALYLNDGPFTDDKMLELQQFTPEGVTVVANFDSCFSGGMDRVFPGNPHSILSKFHQMPGVPYMTKKVKTLAKTDSKWVINAFCGEGQTCADAYFDNRANGAGTYYYLNCFTSGTSFRDAMTKFHTYLPGHGFDQIPVLLGNGSLFDYKY